LKSAPKASKNTSQRRQFIRRLTLVVVLEEERPLAGVEGRSGRLGLDGVLVLLCYRLLDDRDFLGHLV
jgi:hypothetical protein